MLFNQRQVAAAQAALERGESGAAERLAAAEEELERALEAVLDAECAGGGGFGGESALRRACIHTYILSLQALSPFCCPLKLARLLDVQPYGG